MLISIILHNYMHGILENNLVNLLNVHSSITINCCLKWTVYFILRNDFDKCKVIAT